MQFHKTVPAISKTANAQYGKFADLETVLSTVTPHLIKNGLVISQTFEPSEGLEPILVTRLLHVSGAEIVSRLPMILGKSSNPLHSFGASCTYLKRYSLLALIGLTADMDGDGDFADTKPAAKLQTQQTPKKGPAVEGVAEDDQPLTTEERKMLVGLISEMKPGKREDFCKSFRFAFKLGDNAKVAPAITSRKHQVWIQENA